MCGFNIFLTVWLYNLLIDRSQLRIIEWNWGAELNFPRLSLIYILTKIQFHDQNYIFSDVLISEKFTI
jgi:hypothetical protein